MAAATTAAPVMSLFMSSIDAAGFKHRPPESNVTPLPTSARVGDLSPRRYSRIMNRGGSSDPAATPRRPPNRSRRIRSSSHTSTARPASEAITSMRSASRRGDLSPGGVFTRSRARLTASPTISARRSDCSNVASSSAVSGSITRLRVSKACRLASLFLSPGPRVATIAPWISAFATVCGSLDGGSATATLSLRLLASRLEKANPAEKAAPASKRSRGPSPTSSKPAARNPPTS